MGAREEDMLSSPDFPDDAKILTAVRDALSWENDLLHTEIRVKVVKTEVTLEGNVKTEQQKRLAGERADAVFGVGRVINNLTVTSKRQNRAA